ncbi:hypothetical protein SAMN04488564_1237 [Lentzea waywayandensis]|uniref:Uncharacterized protein n=2 Tax=Lentzea waywayandensis TaxID=84724 RepID=A0A1I6FIY6_9PSEU|nr:hypothetical protein SAMN04488564_1237 [Lentzea waywayandensis]
MHRAADSGVIGVSVLYLAMLFAIVFYGDRRADAGRGLARRGTIYALSLRPT